MIEPVLETPRTLPGTRFLKPDFTDPLGEKCERICAFYLRESAGKQNTVHKLHVFTRIGFGKTTNRQNLTTSKP